MFKIASLTAALAAAALATPAAAAEFVTDFQLYVLGDLKLNGQTISNRIAVGGDAAFSGTSIGGATAAFPSSLVVGGDLTYSNGGSIAGQALVGGANGAFPYMPVVAGLAALPVDFDAENLRLKNLSAALAGYSANGAAELKWGGLFLTGHDAGLNVFTIDASKLSQASWFSADIASGSQVLINVTGANANLAGGLNFYTPSNILWNFSQASTITAGGLSLSGTVLAPNATFIGAGGTISGNLVAGNFKGAMSFADADYAGSLLTPPAFAAGPTAAVPEPAAWGLMILGFGAVGALLRRQAALRRGMTTA